ncbi:hypothetical protein ACWDQZ_27790 [Streptomyces tendae]
MDIVEGSIAAIAAAFSGWAAFGAMRAAKASDRNAQTANRTAELAYQTAESIAQIERNRWHKELTPSVRFLLTKERGWVELQVRYTGPAGIARLDIELAIRDDRDRTGDPVFAGGLTAREREETIWGPYRFQPAADGVEDTGRGAEISLIRGEMYRLPLERTSPHQHYGGGRTQWLHDYENHDVRLFVDCRTPEHNPWYLHVDLPQHEGASPGWETAH